MKIRECSFLSSLESSSPGLGEGVSNTLVDTTDTDGVLKANVDIAFVTPGRAPRVTNDVIAFGSFRVISNGDNSMVCGGSTSKGTVRGNDSR